MMIKRDFLITGVVFVAMVFFGSIVSQDACASVMYISKRIKIVRPAGQKMASEQKTVAAKAPVESAKSETPQPGKQEQAAETMVAPPVSGPPGAMKQPVAQMPEKSVGIPEPETLFGKKQQYYSRKDRIDPFAPFLHKPEVEAGTQGPETIRRTPLTPLEKIAIQQLKLTAILSSPGKDIALVQEPSGKGYILNKGTYIGEKGGRVSQILKDRVIIEEKYRDIFGKTAIRKIELKLKKAGE